MKEVPSSTILREARCLEGPYVHRTPFLNTSRTQRSPRGALRAPPRQTQRRVQQIDSNVLYMPCLRTALFMLSQGECPYICNVHVHTGTTLALKSSNNSASHDQQPDLEPDKQLSAAAILHTPLTSSLSPLAAGLAAAPSPNAGGALVQSAAFCIAMAGYD